MNHAVLWALIWKNVPKIAKNGKENMSDDFFLSFEDIFFH